MFNSAHSSTRVEIERAFGLLKGKFRKLKLLDMTNVEAIPGVVVTCCALHNFILKNEHIIEDDIELFEYDRNDACANEVCPVRNIESVSGIEKRLEIMNSLL